MVDLLERLLKQNPWWEGKAPRAIAGLEKRQLFGELLKYIDKKQILVLTGLRRVGKTVLMHQLIEHLLRNNDVEPKRIAYFSFDELLAKTDPDIIETVVAAYENDILRKELENVYVFLDEINHVADWQVVLKRFYDLNGNIKFVVSGSSSVQIKEAKESLAGRVYEFELKPLSFSEFLKMRHIEVKDLTVQSLSLKKEIPGYLMRGGFPEIANEADFETSKKYVSSVVDKIIFYDLPKVFDVGNPEIMKEVFNVIAKNPGSIVEYKNISSALKVSYQTVSKYVHYMEKSYLIKSLFNFRGSPMATARKSKKIYLGTTALVLPVLDSEADFFSLLPKLVENAVVSHLGAKYFWREYFELDILYDGLPMEVKYRETVDIENNIKAVKKLGGEKLFVITKDTEKQEQKDGIAVQYVPLWKFLLDRFENCFHKG